MKKYFVIASIVSCMATPLAVLADPTPVQVTFICPNTTGVGLYTLSNFAGARIAGYGTLTIAATPGRDPYFTTAIPVGANIPGKINTGGYTSSSTDYDPEEAIVSCSYTSATFDPFTVKYQMTNGPGGVVFSQAANTITITQYIAYH